MVNPGQGGRRSEGQCNTTNTPIVGSSEQLSTATHFIQDDFVAVIYIWAELFIIWPGSQLHNRRRELRHTLCCGLLSRPSCLCSDSRKQQSCE